MSEKNVLMHARYNSGDHAVNGFLSRPTSSGPWPAVIIVHEWWGLDDHFRNLTRTFASNGYVALAPDLFHGKVLKEPTEASRMKTSLDYECATQEVLDGISYLKSLPFVNPDKIGIVGFCMGGGIALLSTCRTQEFSAGVIYFQSVQPDPSELANISCPLQLHYGEEDIYLPKSEVAALEKVLQENNKSYQIYFYKNAGHAFTNELWPPCYRKEAAEESWPRTFAFFQEHLKDT